jgi:fermentation-respiration switch protein FrsA (DUF1100 family)
MCDTLMDAADAIREQGFRRWYERQLIEGHAWLVTGFLSLILTAIAIEVIAFGESIGGMLVLLAVGAGGAALCLYAWLRFNRQLFLAEHVAEQATCQPYGKLAFVSASHDASAVRTLRSASAAAAAEWAIR